ncbi:sialate O-acetylesterase [Lewinella aquimaris]|uniref:Sialate O-acetylesterase n=1 Tax=Neolewinella aquimaris TaxID=1835722 RepID=A0A840EBA5_9BACT|nr:sialate O-acetylesterase [Neolewinella aquimaris]MBB4080982.1 sialate O-acetylesterase [Neolewinella aquimaris]
MLPTSCIKFGLIIAVLAAVCGDLAAKVRLPDILTDHMVLQRDQEVPIWGWADPGVTVTVTFAGQIHRTQADEAGNWSVRLTPLQASNKPRNLIITDSDTLTLSDILVGEVWLCTGQSNMQWRLLESAGGEEAIAAADHPEVRLYNVSRSVAFGREAGKLGEWQPCTSESVASFSGVGYFFGLELYRRLGIPVGLINASYGGSQAEAWTPRDYLAASADLKPTIEREEVWKAERPRVQAAYDREIAEWKAANAEARQPRVPDALRDYRIAGSIYGNIIAPLIPYAIRGAAWYQGESNEERAEQYEELLATMVRAWREKWGQGVFPFAVIQLPNFRASSATPEDLAWSHLRDRQRRVAERLPHMGLIVTIDVGEADDIHPTNKYDVGMRLARYALSSVYGEEGVAGGPRFQRAEFSEGTATLFFDRVGEGLRTRDGGPPQEFALAGPDGTWHWARAAIEGPDKVIVRSHLVTEPRAVRYAFSNNPDNPNLTNESGVPASPFRSDDWPGPTHGKR